MTYSLRKAATALGERAADVVKVLDWGQANNIRDIRNDIIHAYWWDYSDVGITRGRVYQDGTSELIQITPAQLDEDCQKLHDYADTLDSAMDGIWLNVYLPRRNDEGAEPQELSEDWLYSSEPSIRISAGGDAHGTYSAHPDRRMRGPRR